MIRDGILNAQLAGALARLGHGDTVVVSDCGLPVSEGPVLVDLAFRFGIPGFGQVLDGLLPEVVVEGATAADEIAAHNADCHALLRSRLGEVELISHEELKMRAARSRLVIRTGEATPFANVLLRCGVAF